MTPNNSSLAEWISIGKTENDSSTEATTAETIQRDPDSDPNHGLVVTFRILILIIGIVGLVTNGFVLVVFFKSRAKRNTSNTCLTNQVVMDTVSSLLLVVSYSFKMSGEVQYEGIGGYVLCILINGDSLIFVVQVGSIASLVLIAAERCFKVAYPVQHKRIYRDWMTYTAIGFAWTNGALMNAAVIWTSEIRNGRCLNFTIWSSQAASKAYMAFLVTWQFFLPTSLFIIFYGCILVAVRNSSRASRDRGRHDNDEARQKARRTQMNIVATMFSISLSFSLSWFPNQLYVILLLAGVCPPMDTIYYATMFLIFLNTCFNPFIYASKHEHIRHRIRAMLKIKIRNNANRVGGISTFATGETT